MAVLLIVVVSEGGPAVAGGGRMAPVRDRYEPGQSATLVGYTGGPVLDTALLDEPFYAYLRPAGDGSVPALDDSGVYVGDLVLRETGRRGYLQLRVSVTFDIPSSLPPGEYEITYCEDPCAGRFLGDLLPSPVSIGVDPVRPVIREWAPDEPEIANLAARGGAQRAEPPGATKRRGSDNRSGHNATLPGPAGGPGAGPAGARPHPRRRRHGLAATHRLGPGLSRRHRPGAQSAPADGPAHCG